MWDNIFCYVFIESQSFKAILFNAEAEELLVEIYVFFSSQPKVE
jgi:hypothetical protein